MGLSRCRSARSLLGQAPGGWLPFGAGTQPEVLVDYMIASNPKVMMGKPVIAGTRITVESILERLGAGESVEDLLEAHPRLTRESIQAACVSAPRRTLPEDQRARLARAFIDSLEVDEEGDRALEIEGAWKAEIERRE